MERSSLRSGLAELLQRSKQALKLYTDLSEKTETNNLKNLQIFEWKKISNYFVEELARAIQMPQGKIQVGSYCLRDNLYQSWRAEEASLTVLQKDLVELSERGDFLKVNSLSRDLAIKKAMMQAYQAACNELDNLLKQYGTKRPVILNISESEEFSESINEDQRPKNLPSKNGAKIIQLRQVRA